MVARVWTAVFGTLWCGGIGFGVVKSIIDGPSGLSVMLLGMLAFGSAIISVNLRMRVVADGDGLHVRNFFREQHHPAASITQIVEHTANGMPSALGGRLAVMLTNGRLLDLNATTSGPFGGARRERQRQQLQDWLATHQLRSAGPRPG